ncbi:MAG: class I SAM-dependent methyltransferase [Pyrinomonadaceae bacterium]
MIHALIKKLFTDQTLRFIRFDLKRARARVRTFLNRGAIPKYDFLHLGCGRIRVAGWVNSDVESSDFDIDYSSGFLPWNDNSFFCVVSLHVIEHLELTNEAVGFLKEINRILKSLGELWISCPDLEKICYSYINDKMQNMYLDRKTRFPNYSIGEIPSQYMINDFFHQYYNQRNPYGFYSLSEHNGFHKNLYDFELLEWALRKAGFSVITRVSEADFIERFPHFPARHDGVQSLYVFALKD